VQLLYQQEQEFNMPLVKINNSNLIRDTQSMALINTDNNEKNEYYAKLRLIKNQKEQINIVNKEISDLRNEMSDIKSLLKQLLEKQ
jgi:hypothetical protein